MPKLNQNKLAESLGTRSEQHVNNLFTPASYAAKTANDIHSRVIAVEDKFKQFAMDAGALAKSFVNNYKVVGPAAKEVTEPKIGTTPTPTPEVTRERRIK